jgi:2-isopropylmalate synthase
LNAWGRIKILSISYTNAGDNEDSVLKVHAIIDGKEHDLVGVGNGPIAAFISIISDYEESFHQLQVLDYTQHAMTAGENASAATFIECKVGQESFWGVGIDSSTTNSSLKAIVSALNRASRKRHQGE